MVTSIVTLISCLLAGAVLSEDATAQTDVAAAVKFVINTLEDDQFDAVTTKEVDRQKRSAVHGGSGGVLGRFGAGQRQNPYDSGAYSSGCGSTPSAGVVFMRCFTPGPGSFQGPAYERNYYRQGNYGDCLNYFNSLPLRNVAPIGDGYTGTLNGPDNRAYQVDACQRCFGGNSGISVRGTDRPYNHLKRNFIFRVNLGVQRAYDGYNGYGRENAGLYGYNGAPVSSYGNPCVGSGCGSGSRDRIGNGERFNNPCFGDGCGGYSGGIADGRGGFAGPCVGNGCGGSNGVIYPALSASLNPGLGQHGDGCVGAGCGVINRGLGGRISSSGCTGTRCHELGRIVGSAIGSAQRGFVDDNGCTSSGVC
ncbi:hypothetical protein LOTGIDRAFT_154520 [Lottia gigantea]|uniref:Uncharacterized protein n=1 Tax=Lottia gigantea TaxID=225164 RepID=V4A170_LOTGI|nr:hypothetical protein LOTGIDRAFT_154520 [Lottia gigantea]ESO87036.1 hypothetical protein LOTGIDRAFT_154520 [Lottia gigantea]